MFDDSSRRTKAVRAALELARERGWRDLSLSDIAQAAGLGLADLRREFACKSDILKAFQAEVDAEVLSKAKAATSDQSMRDRVFDIVMTRFEVMAPYKPALKRISADLCCRPGEAAELACSTLTSQYWMLAGAGAKLNGASAALRVTGLAAIYAKVFGVWLNDDTPGLDRTMAALDRRLRKGEDWLVNLESVCRFACGLIPRGWRRRERRAAQPDSSPDAAPNTSGA